MKKKLILALVLVALLSCVFAISISAQSVKADSTSIDMKISFFDENYNEIEKVAKVDELFNVDFKNDETEYYFKLTGVKSWDVEIDGTTYNIKKQLAGLYFPEGITHMPSVNDGYWGFSAASKEHPREIHLPESLVSLGGNFLRGIGHVKLVNEDGTYDNYMPSSLTTVSDHMFCNWTLHNEILYFPENFHNIGTAEKSQWHLEGFSQVNNKLTLVFFGKMTFIEIDTHEKTFAPTFIFTKNTASDLWGYALPMVEGSTSVASTASYISNTNPDENTLRLYWISKDGTNASMNTKDQTATIGSSAPRLVFCAGDKVEYVMTARFCTGSSYPNLYDDAGVQLNAKGITGYNSSNWMRFYTTPIEYDMKAHATANIHYNEIVYNAGNCGYDETTTNTCVICKLQSIVVGEKATGNHTYTDDFNCETALSCEVCLKTLVDAITHNIGTVMEYENGYLAVGTKTVGCTNEGCTHGEITELAPLFNSKGYSQDENSNAVVLDFSVDRDAIKEYEEYLGTTVSYGVVAALANDVYEGSPLNGDASAKDGAISMAFENTSFSLLQLKLTGIDQKDTALYCSGYIAFDGTVSYINGDRIASSALKISYNNYTGIPEEE